MASAQARTDLDFARASLADEWLHRQPVTSDDVASFYREAKGIGDDLDAWHALPGRQAWTNVIVDVARRGESKSVVDIGAGAGHDLIALRQNFPEMLCAAVEPNQRMATRLMGTPGVSAYHDARAAPIEDADLLICIDVLEHLVDPELFARDTFSRAKGGALLVEATGTHDVLTPLHLITNRGWHPGRALESVGWSLREAHGRLRVWQRVQDQCIQHATLIVCAHRAVQVPTIESLLALNGTPGWRLMFKHGDGLISRARAQAASTWWRETASDVFLMIDDDISFTPEDAEHIVALCRDGHEVICGAYPVRDGGHFAARPLESERGQTFGFGADQKPREIMWPGTGFMAVHRVVLDELIPTLPLLHADAPWCYWPLFDPLVVDAPEGNLIKYHLSEDWAFGERARRAGFTIWLDPAPRLQHLTPVPIHYGNMAAMYHAIHMGEEG